MIVSADANCEDNKSVNPGKVKYAAATYKNCQVGKADDQEDKESCEAACRKCELEDGAEPITGYIFNKGEKSCLCHTASKVDKSIKKKDTKGFEACFFGMPFYHP